MDEKDLNRLCEKLREYYANKRAETGVD
jgi:hypothetical protein